MRTFPRPGTGALVQARFAVYVLQFQGIASGRNQHGVFAARGGGSGAVGYAKLLPPVRDGEFAKAWSGAREAALQFFPRDCEQRRFDAAFEPELDILAFVPKGDSIGEIRQSRGGFSRLQRGRDCIWAVAELPVKILVQPEAGKWTGDGDLFAVGADEAGAPGVGAADRGPVEECGQQYRRLPFCEHGPAYTYF